MAMRNYGAMLDAKLMQCIAELHAQTGDAYDRVMQKQRDVTKRRLPEARVEANLAAAAGVAAKRGLMPGQKTSRPAPPPPAPEKVNTVCRGCGGTGVDHTVHVRLLQAAEGPWTIGPKPDAQRARRGGPRVLHLGTDDDDRGTSFGSTGMALAQLLDVLAKAQREGRQITHQAAGAMAFPLTKADACTWCNGTGEPQS